MIDFEHKRQLRIESMKRAVKRFREEFEKLKDQNTIENVESLSALEEESENFLVNCTFLQMLDKLRTARVENQRGGWYLPSSEENIIRGLDKAIEDKDYISVMNFAAMLYVLETVWGNTNANN